MASSAYGIDLGTCNIKIYSKGDDSIMTQKNIIAIENKNFLFSYGDPAFDMYEKAPSNIHISYPLCNGVIADIKNMQTLIKCFITDLCKGNVKPADYVIAVPTEITDVEKRGFNELFLKSKNRPKSVLLCEKPIADAVGLGLDVNEPTGVMMVDMGADTTEISIISLGGLVISELMPFGGNRLDESIISHIRKEFNLVIGQKTAKTLKESIGSALPGRKETMVVVGRDVVKGLPVEMEISAEVIYNAMRSSLESICTSIKMILEKTPPELAKDIIHTGIYITGGGSLIHGLDTLFEEITNIKVNTCEQPEESAARGLVKIVSDSKYKRLPFTMKNNNFK